MTAQPAQLASYRTQDAVYHVLQECPAWRDKIENMVKWERGHPSRDASDGWEWQDVSTPISIVNSLITREVVIRTYSSRSSSQYRLRSLEDTVAALEQADNPTPEQPARDVEALFSLVIGHDRVKSGLRYALRADGAVHCLLVSPPGMAKTIMLGEVGALPGAHYYLGTTTTKSGLLELLIQEQPEVLVIDEIEKMATVDRSPLLALMETGMVYRLIHGQRVQLQLRTKVFAGANDVNRVDPPLLSRFAVFEMKPYGPAEFLQVGAGVLQHRMGFGAQTATLITSEVAKHSMDIRDVVRVARMWRGTAGILADDPPEEVGAKLKRMDVNEIFRIVACLFPGKGDGGAPVALRR